MIKWKKPNGTIIETNDTNASFDMATELGWDLVEEEEPKKPKKTIKKKKEE